MRNITRVILIAALLAVSGSAQQQPTPFSLDDEHRRADGLFSQGYFREADRQYRLLIERAEASGDLTLAGHALRTLATLSFDKGLFVEAHRLCSRALEVQKRKLGEKHADVALTMGLLGLIEAQAGNVEEGERLLRDALSIAKAVLGPDDPELGGLYSILSTVLVMRNELTRAEPVARLGLALAEKKVGPDHPDAAILRQNLANIHIGQGECAQGELLTRQVLEALEKRLGDAHPDVIRVRGHLVTALCCLGQFEEAEALLEPTLRSTESSFGPRTSFLVPLLVSDARIHRERSEYKEAAESLHSAIDISRETGADRQPQMIDVLIECEFVIRKGKRTDPAKQLEQKLAALYGPDWQDRYKR